jgi:hypothetical protein
VAVTGYRAPSFLDRRRTPWAFMVLAEQGYAYSSSVAPVAHDHYGWREAPRFAFRPLPGSGSARNSRHDGRLRGPAAGGGRRGLLPRAALWLFALGDPPGQPREGRPAVFYFHPWEIDPDQPRVAGRR